MSEINDPVTGDESPREGEPNPNQKRASDSAAPTSTAKKAKTEDHRNPEVGLVEVGLVEDKPATCEMGFEIEADAAEDKGSRHTMEDAWVVLLDAGLDSPGKLRFLFFVLRSRTIGFLVSSVCDCVT